MPFPPQWRNEERTAEGGVLGFDGGCGWKKIRERLNWIPGVSRGKLHSGKKWDVYHWPVQNPIAARCAPCCGWSNAPQRGAGSQMPSETRKLSYKFSSVKVDDRRVKISAVPIDWLMYLAGPLGWRWRERERDIYIWLYMYIDALWIICVSMHVHIIILWAYIYRWR